MSKKKTRRAGRPSKWESHVKPNLDRIPKIRRQGYTERQISELLGVGYSTFMEYKKKYPELSESLKNGKTVLIEDLEDSLYRKALGLVKITETKKYVSKRANGTEDIRVEETVKQLPPDTGAIVFSLKNLDPSRWSDNRKLEIEDPNKEVKEDIRDLIDALSISEINPGENDKEEDE